MMTLKNQFNKKEIDSDIVQKLVTNYSKRDCVRIVLYCAEDCFNLNKEERERVYIDLVKKWLDDSKPVKIKSELNNFNSVAIYAVDAINADKAMVINNVDWAIYWACRNHKDNSRNSIKLKEYLSYARLFAYEDLSFPYRKEAKTFNLDDETDLNIFLDFLTDHYPTALIYRREEFMKKRFCKEYLKIIYQE